MPFVFRILTPEKLYPYSVHGRGCNVTPTPLEFPNANSDLYEKQGLFPPPPRIANPLCERRMDIF